MKILFVFICFLILQVISMVRYSKMNTTIPKSDLIRQFTNYYIKFGHSESNDIDSHNDGNITHALLMKHIDRCVRHNYYPRVLRANQISWKKSEKSRNQKGRKNSSMINSSMSQDSFDNGLDDSASKDNSSDIIYDFMAFAMLLPSHPFSQDLYLALTAVAPMFPMVNVVVGSGYEFKEMCSQYGVRSFPKLMFFTKGHLTTKYKGDLEPSALAVEISRWTKSFPRAYPVSKARGSGYRSKAGGERSQSTSSMNKLLFTLDILGFRIPIRIPPSTEPIMGSAEGLVEWDNNGMMLLVSLVYVILRVAWWAWRSR